MSMMLKDKRFWIWEGMFAIIPFIMALFAIIVLIYPYGSSTFSEWLHSENIELFIIWEVSYLLAAALSYKKVITNSWGVSFFICWGIVCPLIVVSSFIWAGIRIHDGFTGLAYFMISCISWVFSILPLLFASYMFKSFQQRLAE